MLHILPGLDETTSVQERTVGELWDDLQNRHFLSGERTHKPSRVHNR